MNTKFNKDFIFGAATAAYQVEGATSTDGRGPCVWDAYYHREGSRFNADEASNFYELYPLDIDMGQKIGMNGIRISISWSRIFPHNNKEINQKGIAFYHRLIDYCISKNVEPMVTLHHFDSPQWIVDQGDWLSKQTIKDFQVYAELCFKEYGGKVKKFATFNEPFVYNGDKYISGECPPQDMKRLDKAIQGMHNMMVAHAYAVKMFKGMKLDSKVGIVHVLQPKYPFDKKNKLDIEAARIGSIFASYYMLDANFAGGYSKETLTTMTKLMSQYGGKLETTEAEHNIFRETKDMTDFLGVNYYGPTWYKGYEGEGEISHNGTGDKGTSSYKVKGIGEAATPANIPTTDWDWTIYAEGIYDIMKAIKTKYPNYNEIYISENGIGAKEDLDKNNQLCDDYRIDFIKQHLEWTLKAIDEGVNIKGFYVWSWQDQFSWTNGYNKRYGLFFVDFKTQKRYDKLSALWYRDVITNKNLDVDLKKLKIEYKNRIK